MNRAGSCLCVGSVIWLTVTAAAAAAQEAPRYSSTKARGFTVWNSCGVPHEFPSTITLHEIAARVRPALWFSPQEPLLANGHGQRLFIPSALPSATSSAGAAGRSPAPSALLDDHRTVFYRVHRLRSRGDNTRLYRILEQLSGGRDLRGFLTHEWRDEYGSIDQEAVAALAWTAQSMDALSEITLRYMFYYPLDVGVGDHLHDLEAVDVDLWVEEEHGCTGIFVRRIQGAAHGVGLYTNTLDVDVIERRTNELRGVVTSPRLRETLESSILAQPLLMYVESGKHATAPSRDGDSHFDMGVDVNVATTEAWGIRDTMRSNRVAPMFSDEMVSDRLLTTEERLESSTKAAGPSCDVGDWAGQEDVGRRGTPRWRVCPTDYVLVRSTTRTDICGSAWGPNDVRNAALRTYTRDVAQAYVGLLRAARQGVPFPTQTSAPGLNADREASWLRALLRGKDFCDGARIDKGENVATALEDGRIGVAHNSFGRWMESVSVTWRLDRGHGLSLVPPLGLQTPFVAGWLTTRLTLARSDTGERLGWLGSIDATYTRSASAFLSPYVRVGLDNNVCVGSDEGRATCERERQRAVEHGPHGVGPDRVRAAWEGGVAIRVKLGGRHAPLWGGRIGVRGNGWSEPSQIRFVFEGGLAVW